MNAGAQRISLTPGYVLHRRPFRDTSLIVEVFARDHGRLTSFARGARGGKPGSTGRFAGLQCFQRLLLSWQGRGEAPSLTGAENDGPPLFLPASQWISGCYLNELLLRLTALHDPQPQLFSLYETTLLQLASDAPAEPVLRVFEKQLLELLGFGLELDMEAETGEPVAADARYRFAPGEGLYRMNAPSQAATFAGSMLLALAAGEPLQDAQSLVEARALMRLAIDHCLEGRELRSRSVARSMARIGHAKTFGEELQG